jgi:hypothetical protein
LGLPTGWRVQLPREVKASSRWGNYSARYAQEGTNLIVTRRLEGARGVYPPESIADLAAWLRAIGQDDVPYLVIEAGTAASEAPSRP